MKQQNLLKHLRIQEQLGSGAFGDVYKGRLKRKRIAVKFEVIPSINPVLVKEGRNMQSLKRHVNLPKVYWRGRYLNYNILIMKLYGPSLEEQIKIKKNFSLITTVNVGIQLLNAIEQVHNAGFIHRDIKPSNILTKPGHVILADFGISKPYQTYGMHIPYRENKPFVGTPKFSSLNSHLGIEQSRRDDIETIGYNLVYFLNGYLPWGSSLKSDIYYRKSESLKQACTHLPSEIYKFVVYAKSLMFTSQPDYGYLRGLLRAIAHKNHFEISNNFDWNNFNHKICSLPLSHEDNTILDNTGPCPINRSKVALIRSKSIM